MTADGTTPTAPGPHSPAGAAQPAATEHPAPLPGAAATAGATSRALDADEVRAGLLAVRESVGRAVVGQDGAVTGLVVALIAGGHVLLEGVPGVAKTLLVRSLAASLDMGTSRVQFTPDLMPSDVTGSLVWDPSASTFTFRPGPVFTHLLLADEINRTPPRTQSALLEAMEERQVTTDGTTRPLPDPFMVIATQNPVEHEGTYPLPEAQLDRFLLRLELPLPAREEEMRILARHEEGFDPRRLDLAGVRAVADADLVRRARELVGHVNARAAVLGYVVDLVRATRESPAVRLGVSPRGATALLAASRAWAFLQGRDYVIPDDVKTMAVPTLAHRISTRPEADVEGVTAARVVETLLDSVPVPR